MARDRTNGRAADAAEQATTPSSTSQHDSHQNPEIERAGNNSTADLNKTLPTSPPSQYANRRRSSSARPASAQITISPTTVCAPRGRTPRSPGTPPRAPFRRPPSVAKASPRRTLGSLTIPPPDEPTPTAPVDADDENTAPVGAPESPPPVIALRRKYKERPQLKDLNEIFWNSNIPVVQKAKAGKRRPQEWEQVDYYQQNEWDTDDDEYPKYVRPSSTPDSEGEPPALTIHPLPHPCEGEKVKLRKDKKRGQFWLGVKTCPKATLAEGVLGRIAQKMYTLPGSASEEDQNEDANRNVDENGNVQTNKDIHPATGLPTGDWLEDQVEDVVAQSEGTAKEWAKLRGDMATLFGEIMIENDAIDEEEWETEELWVSLAETAVGLPYLRELVSSVNRSFDAKALHRMEEPFLEGEPTAVVDLSDSGGEGDTDDEDEGLERDADGEIDREVTAEEDASGLVPAADDQQNADHTMAQAIAEAKAEYYRARYANLPPGAGHKYNASRLIKQRGRKARKPPHHFVSPGVSPLCKAKETNQNRDEAKTARVEKQKKDAPQTATVPKQNADAPGTASVSKNTDAPKSAHISKQNGGVPKTASAPEQIRDVPKAASIHNGPESEEQFWEDGYDEEDGTSDPFQRKNNSPSNEEDEKAAEASAESKNKQLPKSASSTPKNVLKRSRESDEDDHGVRSDDENRAPMRPTKRRKISSSSGASDEETPVDSASQAEYDRNMIDETDEPSSNRRLSTSEQSSSEDSEDGDMADDEDEDEDNDEARAKHEADETYLRWLRRTSEEI